MKVLVCCIAYRYMEVIKTENVKVFLNFFFYFIYVQVINLYVCIVCYIFMLNNATYFICCCCCCSFWLLLLSLVGNTYVHTFRINMHA